MSELRDNYPYMLVGSIGLKNGRGIATECVRLIINYAFSSSGLGKRGDSLCLSKK